MKEQVKIHVGAGNRDWKGWINVDIQPLKHIDHVCDGSKLDMFADNYADVLYASHVLEYWDRIQAIDVLDEWYRVLRPGGTLRIAVPDFSKIAYVYWKHGELLEGPLFGRMMADGNIIYHKTVYDYKSLKSILYDTGFKDVMSYDFKKTEHAQHDDHSKAHYPHDPKSIKSGHFREDQICISLNVEATK